MHADVKDVYGAIFGTDDLKTPPGPRLTQIIDTRITEMAAGYRHAPPARQGRRAARNRRYCRLT
jgi:hypothetical protein